MQIHTPPQKRYANPICAGCGEEILYTVAYDLQVGSSWHPICLEEWEKEKEDEAE